MFSFQPQVPQLTEEERRALRQKTYATATNFTLIAIGLNLAPIALDYLQALL